MEFAKLLVGLCRLSCDCHSVILGFGGLRLGGSGFTRPIRALNLRVLGSEFTLNCKRSLQTQNPNP